MAQGLGYWPLRTRWGDGVCELERCRKYYTKRAKNQKFCCDAHEIEKRNARRGERDKAERRARKLRERECV